MEKALTRKGAATRARIVEAAAARMFEVGVAGTSLDDVKAAAGVSSSQLYHYFADKRALVLAVVEHQTDLVLAGQEPLLAALDSPEALRAWRDAMVAKQRDLSCAGGCPIGSLAPQLAETDVEARARLAAGFARWHDAIRAGLAAMAGRGQLAGDPDRLAYAALAALQGGMLLDQVRRDTTALEAALDTFLESVGT